MRFTLLTPGTGHFYCGSCLRDDALGRALRRQGHDVSILPLYLPFQLEHGPVVPPDRVFLGGVNLYLLNRGGLGKRLPTFVKRWLDRPALLRWSATRSDMTSAAAHAEMTVSTIRGEHSVPAPMINDLLAWLRTQPRPDAIILSNAMLLGLARPIRRALNAPVFCTLQGEQPFLDALPQPWRDQAWSALVDEAREVDGFIGVSTWYADLMRARLGIPSDLVRVVWNGIEVDGIPRRNAGSAPDEQFVIGYLARLCRDKGLETLVDAFIRLRRDRSARRVVLRAVGVALPPDIRLIDELKKRLRSEGMEGDVEFHPNVDRARKIELLSTFDVLSVPATYGESFGLYVIEAMACGVPAVQPSHGAFPEIAEATGGMLLCKPDDPASLAACLRQVIEDAPLRRRLSDAGHDSVRRHFTADRMAREVAEACMMPASQRGRAPHGVAPCPANTE
jgi:glycosyltransferase involved in cell wall biosynthesis